jgi:hypothetical protein
VRAGDLKLLGLGFDAAEYLKRTRGRQQLRFSRSLTQLRIPLWKVKVVLPKDNSVYLNQLSLYDDSSIFEGTLHT